MSFERIRKNYIERLWSKQMVKNAVEKGIITKEQYYFITNEVYEEVQEWQFKESMYHIIKEQ